MARFSRRRRKLVQNGVNAIFSGKSHSDQPVEIGPNCSTDSSAMGSRDKKEESRPRVSGILVAILLIGIGLMAIGDGFVADHGSSQVLGHDGQGPRSPIKVVARAVPSFYSLSNVAETVVQTSGSYAGTTSVAAGDFLVVQIAYSEGSPGNLPDISNVSDSVSSVYSRVASASPGVGSNFWEQVWTRTASSSSASTNITITLDWADCLAPCVGSIIIAMTIARYRGVSGVGASTVIAQNASSTSQRAIVAVAESGPVLVELLSHGAHNNCGTDAAQPGSGQTSRNCFTGTTERTEFFDRSVLSMQVYMESYSWSQIEVQRGIYLELDGGDESTAPAAGN